MGKEVKQDRADIIINRGEREAKVLSPVSGVVTDINPSLREKGNLANEHPYSKGWVLRIHSNNLRHDIRRLMISGETKDFLKQEVGRLYQVIEETVPLAADGGHQDAFGGQKSAKTGDSHLPPDENGDEPKGDQISIENDQKRR